ncbi:MAG: CopG family transcriptional regulator [uncultured Campylobacterales bacterium]|uniref:CopG family transcriptional regulator n=1 Tax=uncultured Campylobacterales bacterium TaxID=352960 RepID=A0A6S6STB9_9BACT|nr:MAG: CopG family transcriptional regulator [uncultured Campylobacterales bacterium]
MKTLTLRVDDSIYEMIKLAASGQKRNISNFIEFATLEYLSSSEYVSNSEMDEILGDAELMKNLEKGREDFENGDYVVV